LLESRPFRQYLERTIEPEQLSYEFIIMDSNQADKHGIDVLKMYGNIMDSKFPLFSSNVISILLRHCHVLQTTLKFQFQIGSKSMFVIIAYPQTQFISRSHNYYGMYNISIVN
ncbi:hypothetical protein SNEBB_008317, partial [Seison nebaliae]